MHNLTDLHGLSEVSECRALELLLPGHLSVVSGRSSERCAKVRPPGECASLGHKRSLCCIVEAGATSYVAVTAHRLTVC